MNCDFSVLWNKVTKCPLVLLTWSDHTRAGHCTHTHTISQTQTTLIQFFLAICNGHFWLHLLQLQAPHSILQVYPSRFYCFGKIKIWAPLTIAASSQGYGILESTNSIYLFDHVDQIDPFIHFVSDSFSVGIRAYTGSCFSST